MQGIHKKILCEKLNIFLKLSYQKSYNLLLPSSISLSHLGK